MVESIAEIMLKEHVIIKSFLRQFEETGDISKSGEMLSRFKWTLEKHFILEEKAIFDVLNRLKGDEISEAFELLRDHQQIMELINNLEEGFEGGLTVNLDRLKEMLEKHLEIEGAFFYPKLDKVLDQQTKTEIIQKAKELIRG